MRRIGQVVLLTCGLLSVSGCRTRSFGAHPNVVGGTLVADDDPVYLATVSLDRNGSPVCTGFLFDRRTVVTAAHCLFSLTPDAVTFGSAQSAKKETYPIGPMSFARHENWSSEDFGSSEIDPLPTSPKNDIGVIVLPKDAPSWTQVRPVKLIGDVAPGSRVRLAGYGRTEHPMEPRGQLRQTEVEVEAFNAAGWEIIWKDVAGGRSSCHGDSGGPMFFVENDGSLTLVGVTSRSWSRELDCREKGIYTDVRRFVPWITATRDRLAAALPDAAGQLAGEWQHRVLQASDGTRIQVDYQLEFSGGSVHMAKNVWLNVFHDSFRGTEKVQVSINTYGEGFYKQDLDLRWENGRYTGQVTAFEGKPVRSSLRDVSQVLKITVDGHPLLDPVGNTSEFTVRM